MAYTNELTREKIEEIRQELKGKDLLCYCTPKPCHGDILLYIANHEEVNGTDKTDVGSVLSADGGPSSEPEQGSVSEDRSSISQERSSD